MALETWTLQSTPTSTVLRGVGYGNGLWVAAGDSGTVLTSPDRVTWTARSTPTSTPLYGVGYGNGLWVAAGDSGTVLTSPDGVTWTQRTATTSSYLRGVGYGNGLWVAADDAGRVLTSPDGVTWTLRNLPTSNPLYGVGYGNSLWVVAGYIGYVFTSPNGVTWTARSTPTSTPLYGVGYGNGLWVAVGDSGTVLTSPDGVTWTQRTTPVSGIDLLGVGYSGGLWVAVGAGGRVITSPDGVTWTRRTTPVGNILRGVAYSGIQWVVVGDAGIVITSTTNVGPDAPTLVAPADGAALDRQQNQIFDWQFNDSNPGDSQSAYNWAYRAAGTTAWTETGWVTSTATQRTIPGGTFTAGDYEWRVATKDAQGVESPWSSTGFFTAADTPPGPTVTDPINGGTIPTEDYTVVWSTPDQDAYQLQVLDGETVVFDTGQVNQATARTRLVQFPDNQTTRSIRVRVLYGGLWSPWYTVTVTVSYTPPPVPWVTATPVDVGAGVLSAIRVDVEDPRLRVDARNLLTNPAGRATSGTVEVRRNAVTNPSFEVDTTGWAGNGPGVTISRDTTQSYSGSASLRAVCDGSAANQASYTIAKVPVTPGDWTASLYVKGTVGRVIRLELREWAGGALVGVSNSMTTLVDGWQRIAVTRTMGATVNDSELVVRNVDAVAHTFYIDAVLLENSTVAGPYLDGSTSPDPDLTPMWAGAPDASPSQLIGQAPVGWANAYYSPTRDRVAALPGGATFTLPTDPGASTLVVETEMDTLRTQHTGTVVTVTETYFRAAIVPGTYTGPYFDGDTPDDSTYTYRWTGTPDASTSERLAYGTSGELAESTEPMVVAHDVWVRGGPEGEIRLAADLPASLPYLWHLPASGVEYEFRARAVGDNGTSSSSEWVA